MAGSSRLRAALASRPIDSVKAQIQNKEGIQLPTSSAHFEGQAAEGSRTLSDNNIQKALCKVSFCCWGASRLL